MADRTIEFLRSKGVTRLNLCCHWDEPISDEDDLGNKLKGWVTRHDEEYSFEGTLDEFEEFRKHYALWDVESDADLGNGYVQTLVIVDGCLHGDWDNTPGCEQYPTDVPIVEGSDVVSMTYDAIDGNNHIVYSVDYDEDDGFSFKVNV